MPNRQQAMIWINDGIVYWRIYIYIYIYMSLSLNELFWVKISLKIAHRGLTGQISIQIQVALVAWCQTITWVSVDPDPWLTWWRHQMEIFSALLACCAGNSPITGEFTAQRPVTRNFDVFFDLRLNQQLSKQWRRRRFETPSRSLCRHWNEICVAWDPK